MKYFIALSIIGNALSILVRVGLIADAEYPRIVKWRRSEDAWQVVISIGMIVWAFYILVNV